MRCSKRQKEFCMVQTSLIRCKFYYDYSLKKSLNAFFSKQGFYSCFWSIFQNYWADPYKIFTTYLSLHVFTSIYLYIYVYRYHPDYNEVKIFIFTITIFILFHFYILLFLHKS